MKKMKTVQEFAKKVCEQLNLNKSDVLGNNEFESYDFAKNNGLNLTGIVLIGESKVSPTLYMNDAYEEYLAEKISLEQVVNSVGDYFVKYLSGHCNVSNAMSAFSKMIYDYNLAKDYIIPAIVDVERNKEMLKDVPYINLENLAIVYRIMAPTTEDVTENYSGLVTNKLCDLWNEEGNVEISVNELHTLALKNARNLLPLHVLTMRDTMKKGLVNRFVLVGISEADSQKLADAYLNDMGLDNLDNMYIISNNRHAYGASVILYTDVLANLYKEHGDLYIIPVSTDDLLVVSTDYMDSEEILEMVKEANANGVLTEDEILSDSVYRYDESGLKLI